MPELSPLPVEQVALASVQAALRAALDGSGPAVVPVPSGPQAAAVLAMARPDAPLERDADGAPAVLVVPTSGSTGQPKGALLTAAALTVSAEATLDRLGGPGQWLLALPLTHIAGLQVLVRSIVSDVRVVRLESAGPFDPVAFAAATARLDGPRRYTALVPTQLRRLLSGPSPALDALISYDAVLVGGAALDAELAGRAAAAGVRVVTTYGMSETCGGCVYDGLPLDGVVVRAPADGPVRLGGPVVFSGYRLRPDLTDLALAVEGDMRWHLTADQGQLDDTGRLQILGRLDDMIITGGHNVAPAMVEAALASHPGVDEVVVLGEADAVWGARVVAVVKATPTAAPGLSALQDHARGVLPPYALPRRLVLSDRIPLLASGKPDRMALQRQIAEQ